MAENKKSFILYADWLEPITKLSNEDAGKLLKCILEFVNNENYDVKDTFRDLFDAICEQIVYEWSKFNPKTKKYHWNYQDGISPENRIIRNSQKMQFWRNAVFNRDGYKCQKCNQIGGELNAHHIKRFAKYPELRFDVSNGITLCVNCHINEHKNGKL